MFKQIAVGCVVALALAGTIAFAGCSSSGNSGGGGQASQDASAQAQAPAASTTAAADTSAASDGGAGSAAVETSPEVAADTSAAVGGGTVSSVNAAMFGPWRLYEQEIEKTDSTGTHRGETNHNMVALLRMLSSENMKYTLTIFSDGEVQLDRGRGDIIKGTWEDVDNNHILITWINKPGDDYEPCDAELSGGRITLTDSDEKIVLTKA